MEPRSQTDMHPEPTPLYPVPHVADAMVGPHGSLDDHGATHGHDDHAHGEAAIGPVDLRLWGAAGLGIVLGIAVAVALAIGASFRLS